MRHRLEDHAGSLSIRELGAPRQQHRWDILLIKGRSLVVGRDNDAFPTPDIAMDHGDDMDVWRSSVCSPGTGGLEIAAALHESFE